MSEGEGLGGLMLVRLVLTAGAGCTTAIGAGLIETSSINAYYAVIPNLVAWGLCLGVLHRALRGPAGNWNLFPVIAMSLMYYYTGMYVHEATVADNVTPRTDESRRQAGGYALLAIGMWAAWLACAPLDFVGKIKDAFGSAKEFMWSVFACMPVAGIIVGVIILWNQYDRTKDVGMYDTSAYMILVFKAAYVAIVYIQAHFGRSQTASYLVMILAADAQYNLLSLPANDDKYGTSYSTSNTAGANTTKDVKAGAVIAWASVLGAAILTYMRVPGLTLRESFAKTKTNLMGPRFYVLALCLAATIIGTIISAEIYDKSWISVNSIAVVAIIIMSRFNEGHQSETFLLFAASLFVSIQSTLVQEITFQDRGARNSSDVIIRGKDETRLAGCLLMVIGMYASWAVLFPVEKINEIIARVKKIGNLVLVVGLILLVVGNIMLSWATRHTTPGANRNLPTFVAGFWIGLVIMAAAVVDPSGYSYVFAAFIAAYNHAFAFSYARAYDTGVALTKRSDSDTVAAAFYIEFIGYLVCMVGLFLEWPADVYTDLKDVKSPSQMQV